jgi:hypothetical protein
MNRILSKGEEVRGQPRSRTSEGVTQDRVYHMVKSHHGAYKKPETFIQPPEVENNF